MDTNVTKEDVIEFGKTIVLETGSINWVGYSFIVLGVFFIILFLYLQIKTNISVPIMLINLCIIPIFIPIGLSYAPTPETIQAHNAKVSEWNQEYIKPYIVSLPKNKITDIKDVKIDYLLQEKTVGSQFFTTAEYKAKPLVIFTSNGEEYHLWAKVILNKEIKEPYIEYQFLNETFNDDYKTDEYNAIYYTNVETNLTQS